MAETERRPLIVTGEPVGICDPASGVCAIPEPGSGDSSPSGDAVSSAG